MTRGRPGRAAVSGRAAAATVIGVISDTHGLLRPDVPAALAGADLILHAGDVGRPGLLDELRAIAPVHAVCGNVDVPGPGLPPSVELQIAGLTLHVSHGHELGAPTPEKLLARYSADVLIYGHTHRALVSHAGGRLVLNPGAAGPRRFHLQPSVARLVLDAGRADAEVIWLP